jgi:hypothetical protein
MNPLTFWFDLSKSAIDAQTANIAAAKKGMAAMDVAVANQKAMTKAAEANLKLMNDWAKMWGMR